MNNEYIKAAKASAVALAKSFKECGYFSEVKERETGYFVVVIDGKYQAVKSDDGITRISEYPYRRYSTISNYRRAEVYKTTFTSNNMKVLTPKKIAEKIKEVDMCLETLAKMEADNIQKHADFLASLSMQKDVLYRREQAYCENISKKENTGKIIGGEIARNGITYDFKLEEDGYISKKIGLHYSVGNDLITFLAISDNKYKGEPLNKNF